MTEEVGVVWERRQAELWDRVFQVTQDVVLLMDAMGDAVLPVVVKGLVTSATSVGTHLVRANASESAADFEHHVKEARLQAIETDYWLRLVHVLQQDADVQRDLSGVITQYAAVIRLLKQFLRHTHGDSDIIARHTKGPKVSL